MPISTRTRKAARVAHRRICPEHIDSEATERAHPAGNVVRRPGACPCHIAFFGVARQPDEGLANPSGRNDAILSKIRGPPPAQRSPVSVLCDQRTLRKKARMSATKRSGASMAAKCPPRLKSDQ